MKQQEPSWRPITPKNLPYEYFTKAADNGMAQAYGAVGYYYQNGLGVEKDLDKMLEYYQKGADAGDKHAQHDLGCFYDEGMYVEQDFNQALKYYQMAADQGFSQLSI